MLVKVLSGFGLLLFVVGVGLGVMTLGGALAASARDATDEKHGIVEGPPLCNWDATLSRRVMAENETQSVLVSATNPFTETCQSTLTLRAPSFDLSPSKDQQTLSVPPGRPGSVGWIVSPRKTGVYEVAVSDDLTTRTLGLSVTNVFGLSAFQSQLLAGLGSILGPMLTAPWWFDKWQQRAKAKPPAKKEAAEKPSATD
ncbi:MAG: hypothetical protein KIT87_04625 [Anaerolineae bacterium]|nr:hypothetical protein [Anaerolineae bacterium]